MNEIFMEAHDAQKTPHYYANHEIQRYSRMVDADEEGVRQQAQTTRMPNNVISPTYNDPSRYRGEQASLDTSVQERYQRHMERQAAKDKRLTGIPKSKVHTGHQGDNEQRPTS